MENKKKTELDLSQSACHSCGGHLLKDIEAETEKCCNPGCLINGVQFTIPRVLVDKNVKGGK